MSASTSAENRCSGAAEGDGPPGAGGTAYSRYLELDTLLDVQRPGTDEHDELLFVIVHQVHELWFKQLLHELDAAQRGFAAAAEGAVLRALTRVRSIIRILINQIDVLGSITPDRFDAFRALLGGSGFQSAQFREIEVVLGRRDGAVADQFEPGCPDHERIGARLREPGLFDSFTGYLVASGRLPARPADGSGATADEARLRWALREVYLEDGVAAQICELLVDLDQTLQEWRFRHTVLARRVIGDKTGTGGSSGAEYLHGSVFRHAFPVLWQVRNA